MKEYILKQKYPSLPNDWEVGMKIGLGDRNYGYSPCSGNYTDCRKLDNNEVENSEEYWEEIIEKEVLLTTEDGVEIFEESQLIWDTSDINWDFLDTIPAIHMKSIINTCSYRKAWAKKENAEKYIELNSPKYSVLDMLKVANHYAYIKNVTEDRILKYLAKNEK